LGITGGRRRRSRDRAMEIGRQKTATQNQSREGAVKKLTLPLKKICYHMAAKFLALVLN